MLVHFRARRVLDDDDDVDGGAASPAWPKSRTSKLSEAVAAAAVAAVAAAVPLPLPPSPKTRVGLLPGATRFLQENALGVHTSATNEDGLRLSHLGDNFRDNNLLLIYSTPG